MTPRERVLAVLRGERADRVPWFGDLDYYATGLIARGKLPPDFRGGEAYLRWHEELGVGFYLQASWPYREVHEGCRIREWFDGPTRNRQIVTPRGTLRERWLWSEITFSQAPVERMVKSPADLPAYRFLFENTRYEPDYAQAEQRRSQVGDIGLVMSFLPWSPLMRMVVVDAGIETVAMIEADAPDELELTLRALRESLDRACEVCLGSPTEVMMITENLSSEVVGRRYFERWLRPYYEKWSRRIRDAGRFSCIHMDGTLAGLLRQVSSVGFTFIEAMTPAPVGDVAVSDWASYRDGSATIYWGGLPGVYFTPSVRDEEFRRHVREVLSVMGKDRRMVLGVADQVPPDALESRIRLVADLVEAFGACE